MDVVQRPAANTRGHRLPAGQASTPEQEGTFRGHRDFNVMVIPRRWIAKRTFAWTSSNRRRTKHDERFPETGAARMNAAMVRLMLTRLARLKTACQALFKHLVMTVVGSSEE